MEFFYLQTLKPKGFSILFILLNIENPASVSLSKANPIVFDKYK